MNIMKGNHVEEKEKVYILRSGRFSDTGHQHVVSNYKFH